MAVDKKLIPDLKLLEKRASDFGFRRATFSEIEDGVVLAEDLLNSKIANAEQIAAMDAVTQCTAWVTGDPVDGIFLTIPLSEAGEAAVRNGTYSPKSPAKQHLCSKGSPCSAFYIGIYAGNTKQARKNIMTAAATLRVELFASVACFARGATDDGVRSMRSLGFGPISGGLPELFVQEALIQHQDKAA